MKNISVAALLLFLQIAVSSAFAQEWITVGDEEYNCELIRAIAESDLGAQPFVRRSGRSYTIVEWFDHCDTDKSDANRAPSDEVSFKVTVKSSVNLRDCAGTSCNRVGQATSGEILDVLDIDDDWYQVRTPNGTIAFIAGWLTTRLPDHVVETDKPYLLDNCIIVPDSSRSSDMDINIIIAGDRRSDVTVDLYAPTQASPLRVDRQLDKTFIDTGEPYIAQFYRWNQWFPSGLYTIEVLLDGVSHRLAWSVSERAQYNVFVSCD
ncbi:MAG: SH3 domain-containing protein [Chloroflexi bacterium]|nr:SH3 domain-containing protein [Chloroflexota bacterium]